MEPKWPALIRLSCLVEPTIETYEQVRRIRKDREPDAKKKTRTELISAC
jgi:hypothetical protein